MKTQNEKLVLGIETSCDDTSVALIRGEAGAELPRVLSHRSFSQETALRKWGGVVPEIAARNHLAKIAPLLDQVFTEAGEKFDDVDLLGVTTHPGLLGPLLTGINAAKSLSFLGEKPIFGINHLYAHLEAIYLTENPPYPYLGLLVSGGHSLYMLVEDPKTFHILGSTIDDAAGEAFDKGGKLMGLGYPAGKIIDDLAKEGNPSRFPFPVGLKDSADARLSFSGIKTYLRHMLEKEPKLKDDPDTLKDLAAGYQEAIIKALCLKLRYAYREAEARGFSNLPLVVGGGVACNSGLRGQLQKEVENLYIVKPKFCTDNGAMIANYALRRFDEATPFPDALYLDAKGRFIDKKEMRKVK